VIWGYYYTDSRGTRREGDFLILGPFGGLLVLEGKSRLPRHFAETGRSEGAGENDPIEQLQEEWKEVIRGIEAKGRPPLVEKALCVPEAIAPPDVDLFQGIDRHWLVTDNNLSNWNATWSRIFKRHAQTPVTDEQKRAVIAAFGQGSLPKEKRASIDHTEELFRRQFQSRFLISSPIIASS